MLLFSMDDFQWQLEKFLKLDLIEIKSYTLSFQKVTFICFNKNPVKIMNHASYFILKDFFIFNIFKFLSSLFPIMQENGLIRRLR